MWNEHNKKAYSRNIISRRTQSENMVRLLCKSFHREHLASNKSYKNDRNCYGSFKRKFISHSSAIAFSLSHTHSHILSLPVSLTQTLFLSVWPGSACRARGGSLPRALSLSLSYSLFVILIHTLAFPLSLSVVQVPGMVHVPGQDLVSLSLPYSLSSSL